MCDESSGACSWDRPCTREGRMCQFHLDQSRGSQHEQRHHLTRPASSHQRCPHGGRPFVNSSSCDKSHALGFCFRRRCSEFSPRRCQFGCDCPGPCLCQMYHRALSWQNSTAHSCTCSSSASYSLSSINTHSSSSISSPCSMSHSAASMFKVISSDKLQHP